MHHSRQPARAVSAGVRARARKYNTSTSTATCSSSNSYSAVNLDDSTSAEAPIVAEQVPLYEPSWHRTGRSSMAADVRIPSFLIPCSASQLMDARYKSRKFSGATTADTKAISPAA
ncbi:uncharacterized protein PITG_16475 [Phytophthora infestans T30-4]|uniref:Uncharacterized protein n=2 Tax=Phytophthora infestans TaxID=4787 RepID=D0NTQ8_PHYIT|nr:uncharacterized protein PITG_16475 [Phytophthora infestans T30-4]EEY65020.1 conserved hypothetical protein [Phytophthora infestans T30-4]KAF4130976.1 hypothetical protein GN958_ATG19826 [Phytophthora infestans]KAI9991688.1 hypothetical protein PInf_017037 [Phytophthora infestans]|eukprot:XP_002897508.1 conserved hypothetical protein [Phytophthora infestans T30-4]